MVIYENLHKITPVENSGIGGGGSSVLQLMAPGRSRVNFPPRDLGEREVA